MSALPFPVLKRAEAILHGLNLRAEIVTDVLESETNQEDRRLELAVLGGIQTMLQVIRDLTACPIEVLGDEFERILDQADESMGRIDAVFQ